MFGPEEPIRRKKKTQQIKCFFFYYSGLYLARKLVEGDVMTRVHTLMH